MGQGYQTVEPEISGFTNDAVGLAVLGRHDQLGSFFADLLQEGVGRLGQQLRDVGRLRIAAGLGAARGQGIGDTRQDVVAGGRGGHL
ncbi:Uncharacterised protein [Bordetella pertussis]|nr:Uncharacterised protein [Bordetella pertussis]